MKCFLIVLSMLCGATHASAAYSSRLSLGAGIAAFNNSSAYFTVSGEYEQRVDAMLGIGGFANYVFSQPGFALIGLPEGFLHPLGGDWYVSAAPIVEFGSGRSTELGARLGTRIPLPLGVFTLIPTFAVDFIGGGEDYLFGLGLQF